MAVLFLVLATRNVNSEVLDFAGLNDGSIKVCVGFQELKPTILVFFVRMGFVIPSVGIGSFGDVDVCYFAKGVLAGICAAYFYVQQVATIVTGDDDVVISKDSGVVRGWSCRVSLLQRNVNDCRCEHA